MNKSDLLKLAEKAGYMKERWNTTEQLENFLERFAALVAAHEREKAAHWMMEGGYDTGHGNTIEALLNELEWQLKEKNT